MTSETIVTLACSSVVVTYIRDVTTSGGPGVLEPELSI